MELKPPHVDAMVGAELQNHLKEIALGDAIHFGPEWMWDQTRPEAIQARREMERFRTLFLASRQPQSDIQGQPLIAGDSAAKHFQTSARHFGLFVSCCLRCLRRSPNLGSRSAAE